MNDKNNKKIKKSNNKNNSNVIKLKTDFESKNFIHTKKLRTILGVSIIIFILLIGRIGFLQFVEGSFLKEKAYNQQTINQIISPKRGNIYDSTGQALAISAQVDTITINPAKFEKKTDEETTKYKEIVAKGLSEIFDLDYQETLDKLNSDSQVETIAKKVEQDKVDELKTWMNENNVSVGINIDERYKKIFTIWYGSFSSYWILWK